MAEQKVKRVVIAGGGTAGWIAAAAMAKTLGSLINVTLVESEEIGTIGVGESTIPTARTFHNLIGIDERAFMRETQSTFKLGIEFTDWARLGDRYFHSFGVTGNSTWIADFHHFWLEACAHGFGGTLGDYCLEFQAAQSGRFATSDQSTINYAYHLDAGRYARFLRTFAEGHGARRVEGKIIEVEQDGESGFVTAIRLHSGERVEGDLFIDCTGFRGLLIEQTLKAGHEDWRHWLPTDSALPIQTASVDPARPYTQAIAHSAGWRWRIPLQHRVGNGLVYSSAHMEDEDAHALLHAGIEGEILVEPRAIRFQAGRRRKVWDKNVVALGLSSGFVEPLESTSIHLIMIAVTRLLQNFPFGGISDAVAARFNDQARREVEGIRDFIILHYKASERDDSEFWCHVRDMPIPDSLAERIALFREGGIAYQDRDELFRVDSWVQVMIGQRIDPLSYHRVANLMPVERLRGALADLKGNIARAVAPMPTHQSFLDQYLSAR